MFKNLRIRIFNWFAAGKLTLTHEKPQEHKMSYTLGAGSPGTINITPGFGGVGQTSQTLTLRITPANGGTIVQVQASEYGNGDLHIIPDGSDFDKELGKIITMSKLRA
jgi:hypothetical protein